MSSNEDDDGAGAKSTSKSVTQDVACSILLQQRLAELIHGHVADYRPSGMHSASYCDEQATAWRVLMVRHW